MYALQTEIASTLDSRDIAEMAEMRHGNLVRDIDGYVEDISQNSKLSSDSFFIESTYTAGTGKSYRKYDCTKMGCEFIANKLTGRKGNQFTAGFVMKFNIMEQNYAPQNELSHFRKETMFLTVTAETLRLPESGRLKLLGDFKRKHRLNVPIPDYAVNEEITESATALLPKNGSSASAIAFNKAMMEAGLLQEVTRPSRGKKKKTFKSITDAGLPYGKNLINPTNDKETQPHYYADKFPELLKRLGI